MTHPRAMNGFIACGLLLALLPGCSKKAPAPETVERPVALLSSKSGRVDHRPAQTLSWRGASAGMPLYNRDALKTGPGARAQVAFDRGGVLEIEEHSLVVIEPRPSSGQPVQPFLPDPVARVEQGTVRGLVAPGGRPMKVASPDGSTTEIVAQGDKPVPFRVRLRENGKLEVAVLEGSARVVSGGSAALLNPGQAVDVTAKQVSAPVDLLPYPELTAPPVDAPVVAGANMELAWRPVTGAAMYRVQVSHLVSFATALQDTTVVVPAFRLPAPKAMRTYVWRVASVDHAGREGEFGFARRFHVKSAPPSAPSQLLAPADNAGIFYADRPPPIAFRWKGESATYEIVVARSPGLERGVVRRRRVQTPTVEIPGLRAGTYYWGVFSLDPAGKRQPLSDKPYKLVVARREPPFVKVPKTIKWK